MFKSIFSKEKTIVKQQIVAQEQKEESLVDMLSISKPILKEDSLEYFSLLKEVGFETSEKVGTGYPIITEKSIINLLTKIHKKERKCVNFGECTVRKNLYQKDQIEKSPLVEKFLILQLFVRCNYDSFTFWNEQLIKYYVGTPPKHVLTSAKNAIEKGFSDLRVVTIETVNDPLLIARHNSSVFLIDWWDKDFTIEDILALTKEKE